MNFVDREYVDPKRPTKHQLAVYIANTLYGKHKIGVGLPSGHFDIRMLEKRKKDELWDLFVMAQKTRMAKGGF